MTNPEPTDCAALIRAVILCGERKHPEWLDPGQQVFSPKYGQGKVVSWSGQIGGSPLRTALRTVHETFALTRLKPYFKRLTWLLNVPACDTLCVGAQDFRCRFVHPVRQELCDGFRFPRH